MSYAQREQGSVACDLCEVQLNVDLTTFSDQVGESSSDKDLLSAHLSPLKRHLSERPKLTPSATKRCGSP